MQRCAPHEQLSRCLWPSHTYLAIFIVLLGEGSFLESTVVLFRTCIQPTIVSSSLYTYLSFPRFAHVCHLPTSFLKDRLTRFPGSCGLVKAPGQSIESFPPKSHWQIDLGQHAKHVIEHDKGSAISHSQLFVMGIMICTLVAAGLIVAIAPLGGSSPSLAQHD